MARAEAEMEEETAAAARVVGRAEAEMEEETAAAARVVGKGCPCTSRHVGKGLLA